MTVDADGKRAASDAHWRALLVCPRCRGDLADHPEGLACPACRRLYPIVDGVPWMVEERSRPLP